LLGFLRNLFLYGFTLLWTILFSFLAVTAGIAVGPFSKTVTLLTRIWSRTILRLSGVRIERINFHHLDAINGSCVIVANHQSNYDIPVLFAALPGSVRYMAKKSLFGIPLFGYALKRSGMVEVDRKHPHKAITEIKKAGKHLQHQLMVVFFPEGTRNSKNTIGDFKKGAFYFARENHLPVVPVVISGAFEVMSVNSWRITPGTIRLTVLPPQYFASIDSKEIERMQTKMSNVHGTIKNAE
jgi:1-acyl-sn-glycerol-3-phosphate acyltransferase